MQITDEMITDLESKFQSIKDSISKIDELLCDVRSCSKDTTRTLIVSAIKKYAMPINEFKI